MNLEKIERIRDGLRWGLSTNLNTNDENLEYNLFEQFEPFVWSELHPTNLRPLVKEGLLSLEEYETLQRIRNIWVDSSNCDYTAEEVRRPGSPFQASFALADEMWKRFEKRLADAGRPTPISQVDDDPRPMILPV